MAAVVVSGLLLTILSTYATARVDYNTEQRLLQTQTKQAAAVLSGAIVLIERPLANALDVQRAVGGDAAAFARSMAPYVGPDKTFVSASLWQRKGGKLVQVTRTGIAPAMKPTAPATEALIRKTYGAPTYLVRSAVTGGRKRVIFAESAAGSPYTVYAERAIPEDGRTPSDRDSAFADLNYATYLGRTTDSAAILTTNLPLTKLPLAEDEYTARLTFGDTELTLVATSRNHLGGGLSRRLPVILLFAGLLLTALASRLLYQVARGRQSAEADAGTIASLYERVDALYVEQRVVSERLQRALLPPSNPVIPNFDVASEYVAGAQGVDIGGDWWSIVRLDDEKFAFVVGDVSGHGIDAVAVMARARFTLRAYLMDGDAPDVALTKSSRQFDISTDGHMATVVVGVGNSTTGEITLANAGHPPPLLLAADGSTSFVRATSGPPLGVGEGQYPPTTFTLAPGTTFVGYTDGLVERRGEDIEISLQRLSDTASQLATVGVDGLVSALLGTLAADSADDVALLALLRNATA